MGEYREGNQPEISDKQSQNDASVLSDSVGESVTSFAVIVRPTGMVDVVVKLPKNIFPRVRDASLRDIRDACLSLSIDIIITMIVEGSSSQVLNGVMKVAETKLLHQLRSKLGNLGR